MASDEGQLDLFKRLRTIKISLSLSLVSLCPRLSAKNRVRSNTPQDPLNDEPISSWLLIVRVLHRKPISQSKSQTLISRPRRRFKLPRTQEYQPRGNLLLLVVAVAVVVV